MKKAAVLSVCVVSVVVMGATFASAGVVSATVDAINTLSSETYFTDVTGATSADQAATDVKVASGVIDDNNEEGWKLTLTSANLGKLIRSAGSADEITYTNIKFVKTGGTLGTGLTDPSGTSKSIVSGSCLFDTGTASTATTATEGYAFELQLSWAADSTLLEGVYQDTITMTLTVDDD